MTLLFVALGLYALGALLALFSEKRALDVAAISSVLGAGIGVYRALAVLLEGERVVVPIAREVLFKGNLLAGVDPLSAFFLVPIFIISAIGAIYARGYMRPYAATRRLGPPAFFFNLLAASLAAVVLARDALTFLFAWEVMTLSAYALVTFEHELAATRRGGFVYLIASHCAMAALMAMFSLLSREANGALSFEAFIAPGGSTSVAILVLALIGFGIKAGFVPFHVWLPEAHAAAPSHVSAMMSGVLIKMGIYGLLRILLIFRTADPWIGPTLIILGLGGALYGISIALYQKDMKRAFAYSSVENVGLIALSLGVGFNARAEHPGVAALGFAGALLHVWNHAAMKSLLFLSAGSVLHGAGSKDLDRLGGLLKRMPATGALMIAGAAAISALPPLNAFASEYLIYLGLIASKGIAFMLSVGFLASIGAITALAFVRVVGIAMLGTPRSDAASNAHESPRSMITAMTIILALMIAMAIGPRFVTAAFAHVLTDLGGRDAVLDAPLGVLGVVNLALWAIIGLVAWLLARRIARMPVREDATWGCGYVAPTARMQYVARSFSELFAEHILPRALRAKMWRESDESAASIFQPRTVIEEDDKDPLTRRAYEPFLARWADRLSRLRWLQAGVIPLYLVYILLILLAGFVWIRVRAWGAP